VRRAFRRSSIQAFGAWGAVCLALALGVTAGAAPAPGDRLAPFTLPTAEGGSQEWLPGRPLVLSFCAFWCDTWKEQNARLAATQNALAGLPVDYLMVSVDGRWSELGKRKVEGPVLLDTGGELTRKLEIRSVPYTIIADASGRIAYASQGIARAAEIQEALRTLIEPETATRTGPVYLTFDDFPAGDGDDELLDALRTAGARATFFCIGRNVERWPEVVKRAAAEGHSIQMHSWAHDAANPQLERCAAALKAATGEVPDLYRPPGSKAIRRGTEELKLSTVDTFDFTRPGEPELLRRILLAAKPGSAIQLHAGVGDTRRTLSRIIERLRGRGLELAVLR
jgi:peptidoglycan-N-acetylglucosamine deacetylase